MVALVYIAICSVQKPRRSASGQSAASAKVKVQLSPQPEEREIMVSRMQGSSRLSLVLRMTSCVRGGERSVSQAGGGVAVSAGGMV